MHDPTQPDAGPRKFLTWFEDRWEYVARASRFGISEWHAHVLESLYCGYGQVLAAVFAERAFGIWYDQSPGECRAAVDDAFARNWIQVLSQAAILGVKSDLESNGYVPAVSEWTFLAQLDEYEVPGGIGTVDFTLDGAELYLRFLRSWSCHEYAGFAVTSRADPAIVTAYGESEAAIEEMLPLLDPEFESLARHSPPEPLGRWYAEWWRRFDQGVRIEFVGRLTPAGRDSYIDPDDRHSNPGS